MVGGLLREASGQERPGARAGREDRTGGAQETEISSSATGAQQLGYDVGQVGPEAERLTVEDVLRALEAQYELEGKERARSQSHMQHLRDYFGIERAITVTTERITNYQRFRREHGAADATSNRELRILRRAFNLAVDQGKFAKSAVPKFVLLSEVHAVREGFVDKGQFQAIVNQLGDPDVKDYVQWGFWTGMRKGEIAKLTWAAFDKETWALTLPGRSAKGKKPRTLALTGSMRDIMKRRVAARRLDCPLIFHRDGQPFKSFQKAWRNACKNAGVSGLLFHDLRRTAIRNMVRAGIDKTVARTISGHRTESVFERYNVTNNDDLKAAAIQLEAYISTLPDTSSVIALESRNAESGG
jgi:integrase